MKTISVTKDFSSTPGGRFRVMGPDSGEEFREQLAKELKKKPQQVIKVVLDGSDGYGSSFLEEAFGGLIRLRLIKPDDALNWLQIVATSSVNETYVREAVRYMREAAVRLNG